MDNRAVYGEYGGPTPKWQELVAGADFFSFLF